MKSVLAAFVALAAVAGCHAKAPAPPIAAPPPPAVSNADPVTSEAASACTLHVDKPWIETSGPPRRYLAEASSLGASCDIAVAVLTIRARDGSPLFTWAGAAHDIFGLKDATDPGQMRTALLAWIDQSQSSLPTSDKLPPWEETAGQPKQAEFPFHPDPALDRTGWAALRRSKLDVFCFPQGQESLACVALQDGAMRLIGLQQFPG